MELLHRPVGGAESPYHIGVEPNSWLLKTAWPAESSKWAVRLVEETTCQVLEASGLATEQIDCWLFDQANVRILDAAIEALEINRERVVMHMDRYGNTSAGSIPIALDETVRAGGIRRGDHLLMSGFGAGLAWGTIVWRW